MSSEKKIMQILLKDFAAQHTVSSLAEATGMTRMGAWKSLKKMEASGTVLLIPIGKGKTSAYAAKLNMENPLLEKTLALLLAEDALKQNKWIYNFKELENSVDFLILFGSVLHSPKEANDIDILYAVSTAKNFPNIDKILSKIQIVQTKKIHNIGMTNDELAEELKKNNRAYIDAIKRGIVLFGQENFIKFLEKLG